MKHTQLGVCVCVWWVGLSVCGQPAYLPSYPPAVTTQCPLSVADHCQGRLKAALCQLVADDTHFQRSVGALQRLGDTRNWK